MTTNHSIIPFSLLAIGCSQPLLGQGFSVERFEATNGALAFGEATGNEPATVGYYVDILSGISIYAAAFSFQQIVGNPSFESFANFQGGENWSSMFIEKQLWNDGTDFVVSGITYDTTSFGTFESLFGSLDDTIALFSDESGFFPLTENIDVDEVNWTEFNEASFSRVGGIPATTGIFLDDKGNIIAASPIPEPSSVLLVALASLGLLPRRRQA